MSERLHLFGEYTLDTARECLLRGGEPVHLRPQSYEVLRYLAEHRGHLVSKDRLIEEVWRGRAVTDGSLGKCIEDVRQALGEAAARCVRTVRGRGYILDTEDCGAPRGQTEEVEVVRVFVEEEEAAEAEGAGRKVIPAGAARAALAGLASPTPNIGRFAGAPKRHRGAALSALALASAAALVAAVVLVRRPDERQAVPVAAAEIRTVAVLPLANLSGDPAQEYFADGMTDELITEIAKLGDVQVISRGSVMRFKNSTTPVPEIARQLGADAVLTGSVVRDGDRARITVQLIHAATDRHLWAESYERDLRDVLFLQRDIALNVGQQISARVAGQQRLAARGRQIDPAAHEAYLKGLFYSNKSTPESITKGLDYFTEATRISPFYPEAHANIAYCYLWLGGWYAVKERDEALAKARAAVTEALREDDTLAEAHAALGYLSQDYEWDWGAAECEFRRAIELNPSYARAHYELARHLLLVGRLDEVPAEVERARSADPLSLPTVGRGAWILEYAGHHQEAVDRIRTVVQMDPNVPVSQFLYGLVHMNSGELDQAADQFRTAIRLYPAFGKFKAHLAFIQARLGDKQQARRLLDELQQSHNIVSFDVALVMAGLGEEERAIDWMEKAYRERSNEMVYLRVMAAPNAYERPFYTLRTNPRFKELLRRMNFSEP